MEKPRDEFSQVVYGPHGVQESEQRDAMAEYAHSRLVVGMKVDETGRTERFEWCGRDDCLQRAMLDMLPNLYDFRDNGIQFGKEDVIDLIDTDFYEFTDYR